MAVKTRVVTVVAVVISLLTALFVAPAASADVSGSQFDPGNIISNDRFFDNTTMSQADIQAFLNRMVPNCRSTDITLPCLKDLVTSTNTRAPSPGGQCGGYNSETWESAARIIWRVGQACGINPQVLLVMLQKEQGLITDSQPDYYQYRSAMGAGCPDTAPCDARFYGFFNQVYQAAWQMREYTVDPGYWNYQVGWNNILWNPNAGCGSAPVYVQNQATANLYNYTPYQPNAAALNNLYGLGNSCSAYGNRNFWRDFNNWFGSSTTDGGAAINGLYNATGGASGPYGAPTSDLIRISDAGGGTARAYVYGSIYWTIRTGAHGVLEPERTAYFQYGGATGVLGWPISERGNATGPKGPGSGQAFTAGSIYSSSAGTFAVYGGLRDAYFAQSGAVGALGFPTAPPQTFVGGIGQSFQTGSIFLKTGAAARTVPTLILTGYVANGGPNGALGWPVSDAIGFAANGGGSGQVFENGSVYGSPAGTFAVTGALRDAYFARGGSTGSLGWPTSVASCTGTQCVQSFQNGTLYLDGAATRVGAPAIEQYVAANPGVLGARVSEAVRVPENGGGFGQTFVNGSVYSSAAGTFRLQGDIRNAYWTRGGSAGALGWPTGEVVVGASGRPSSQSFQFGTLFRAASGQVYLGDLKIETLWWDNGGPSGAFGDKASDVITIAENGGGLGQVFTAASIYSSKAGTFAVSGGIRSAYFGVGGSAGRLGWPIAPMSCTAQSCTQRFQNGTITLSAAGTATITP